MNTHVVRTRVGSVIAGVCLTGFALVGCSSTAAPAGASTTGALSTGGAGAGPSAAATTAASAGLAATPIPVDQAPDPTAPTAAIASAPDASPSVCPSLETEFVKITSVGDDPANGAHRITAAKAEIICGPGVPDDNEYLTVGSPQTFDVSPSAKIQLILSDARPSPATWSQLTDISLESYGGYFGIDVDETGLVTTIDEYYHP